MILARDFTWTPSAKPISPPSGGMLVGLGIALVGVALGFAYSIYRSSRYFFSFSHEKAFQPTEDELARLDDVEPGPTIAEQLNDLAKNE